MAALIDALRPWHTRMVFVGGWAHRLHRLHPGATIPRYQPVVTRDADVAFDPATRLPGNIAHALAAAGFVRQLTGEHRPPVSHFQFGNNDAGFYTEFLSPLRGSSVRRDGTENATASVAGVTTQKLRYLELLLVAPWTIALSSTVELPIAAAAQVLVANPVSFIVQKLLIRDLRTTEKQAQDVLYIHDTIELFGAELALLNTLWRATLAPRLARRTRQLAMERGLDLFGAVNDTTRSAIRQLSTERRLTPTELRLRLETGIRAIFGPDLESGDQR